MGINVRHSVPAAILGQVANRIGQGQHALQEQSRQDTILRDLQQLALAQDQIRARKESEQSSNQAAMDRQNSRHGQSMELQHLRQNMGQEDLMLRNELQKDGVRYEFTMQQQQQMEKIRNGIAWVDGQVAGGLWTQEEGDSAETELMNRYHGIQPLPTRDNQVDTQQQFEEMIAVDHETGIRFMRNAKGSFDPIKDEASQNGLQLDDLMKLWQAAEMSLSTTDDQGVQSAPDPTKVEAKVRMMMESQKRLQEEFYPQNDYADAKTAEPPQGPAETDTMAMLALEQPEHFVEKLDDLRSRGRMSPEDFMYARRILRSGDRDTIQKLMKQLAKDGLLYDD